MTLAPDYSRAKRFWYWFFTGHTLDDPRFRGVQPLPGNAWVWRDEEGLPRVALPAPAEFVLLIVLLAGLFLTVHAVVMYLPPPLQDASVQRTS